MKIAVIMPTRERPLLCSSVLMALDQLSSKQHEVTYTVRCDKDRPETIETLSKLPIPTLRVIEGEPPLTLGHKVNEAYREAPEADVYVQVCDDSFPLTQGWDDNIARHIKDGMKAFCWNDMNEVEGRTYPVLSKELVKLTNKVWPEYFPYWFADTWISEIYYLACGKLMPIIKDLKIGGHRGKTIGARDIRFWFKFFAYTRPERVEAAKKLQGVLKNWIPIDTTLLEQWDRIQDSRCDQYEVLFADKREPSENYLKAKSNAEELMKC